MSDYAGAYTGFGKQTKLFLEYLYKTGKYEILNAAQGIQKYGDFNDRYPWKTLGVLPTDPNLIQTLNKDPQQGRLASYGKFGIEEIVKEFKPDVIFSVNDTWGSQYVTEFEFFKKIPTICWNTFDSLPLLPETITKAKDIKYYWTWSDFARKEFHKHNFKQVKNQYPLVNTKHFYKLSPDKIAAIKQRYAIPQDSFIIGFVFRNQLRKLINTQIEAYALFKKQHPEIKNTFLYTHTNYSEGWDIHRLCQQYGVNPKEILCTYICKETKQYFIAPFHGQNLKNPITQKETLVTVNTNLGVTDVQLNEIYNIFSLYSHPATSGACELPCVEAALTEKIIVTCNYSFGEDIIENNQGSMPIKFNFYTEHGTQFLKSQPSAYDLSNIFYKVYKMKIDKKLKMEKLSRKWALNNYSIETNGGQIEEFIDSLDFLPDETFNFNQEKKQNPQAVIPDIEDNIEWLIYMYKHILSMTVDNHDKGLQYWLQQLSNNTPRKNIETYFRQVAEKELNDNKKVDLEYLFDVSDLEKNIKRVLIIQPESLGDIFLLTSTFESLRNRYPKEQYKIYVATKPEYQDILNGNPFVDKWIPYLPVMDSAITMEGGMGQKGFCDIVYHPYFSTQRLLSYTHNGQDKIDLKLT